MQKRVIVVYDFYEVGGHGQVIKTTKWEAVGFSKENTAYDDSLSYEENVRNFVSDCVESQAVYIGEKYIPLHNIHGWYFEKQEGVKPVEIAESQAKPNHPNQPNQGKHDHNKRHNRFKKIKHRHESRTSATTNLPFKVETDVVPAPVEMPKHEDLMQPRLQDEP